MSEGRIVSAVHALRPVPPDPPHEKAFADDLRQTSTR
jgi:hypothetical protein